MGESGAALFVASARCLRLEGVGACTRLIPAQVGKFHAKTRAPKLGDALSRKVEDRDAVRDVT